MKRLVLPLAAVAAAVAGFLIASSLRGPAPIDDLPPPASATEMIVFSLPDVGGRMRSIEEWRGKVLVLNFWATWCPPCREEIPAFMRLQEKLGGRGLQVIGVAIDEVEAVRDYRDGMLMDYPILIGQREAIDLMSRYGNLAGVLPYSVIMDRDGKVRATKQGAYTEAELEALLLPLL